MSGAGGVGPVEPGRVVAEVRVPATTANLGPGFDAFGAAVGLHLTARLVGAEPDRDRVRSAGEGADELPGGDDNLLWRSFLALHAHIGAPVPDLAVEVESPLPLERGLGSSSAAIVAGLGLARAVTDGTISDRHLVRVAAEIEGHADNVAPAVLGGLVVAASRDDGGLVLRRAQPHPRLCPFVLVPGQRQRTSTSRAALPERLDRGDVVVQAARAGHVLAGLLGVWPTDPGLVGDRLHEPTRLSAMPASGELLAELRGRGVLAWLSGAGPTVAGAIPRRAADDGELAELAAAHGFDAQLLDWDLAGLVRLT